LTTTTMAETLRATWAVPASPTTDGGATLDFFLVSRHLSGGVTATADWSVPWRPHAAATAHVTGAVCTAMLPTLQTFPTFEPCVKQSVAPSGGLVSLLLHPRCFDSLSHRFAALAKCVEISALGESPGRGSRVTVALKARTRIKGKFACLPPYLATLDRIGVWLAHAAAGRWFHGRLGSSGRSFSHPR
jgi:hypothetical protein